MSYVDWTWASRDKDGQRCLWTMRAKPVLDIDETYNFRGLATGDALDCSKSMLVRVLGHDIARGKCERVPKEKRDA